MSLCRQYQLLFTVFFFAWFLVFFCVCVRACVRVRAGVRAQICGRNKMSSRSTFGTTLKYWKCFPSSLLEGFKTLHFAGPSFSLKLSQKRASPVCLLIFVKNSEQVSIDCKKKSRTALILIHFAL